MLAKTLLPDGTQILNPGKLITRLRLQRHLLAYIWYPHGRWFLEECLKYLENKQENRKQLNFIAGNFRSNWSVFQLVQELLCVNFH